MSLIVLEFMNMSQHLEEFFFPGANRRPGPRTGRVLQAARQSAYRTGAVVSV